MRASAAPLVSRCSRQTVPRSGKYGLRCAGIPRRNLKAPVLGICSRPLTRRPTLHTRFARQRVQKGLSALNFLKPLGFWEEIGAPGTIRTSDPQIRSLMLYPAELRARAGLAARAG